MLSFHCFKFSFEEESESFEVMATEETSPENGTDYSFYISISISGDHYFKILIVFFPLTASMAVASSVGGRSTERTEISGYSHERAIEFWTEALLWLGLQLGNAGTSAFVEFIRAEFQCPEARAVTEASVVKQAKK